MAIGDVDTIKQVINPVKKTLTLTDKGVLYDRQSMTSSPAVLVVNIELLDEGSEEGFDSEQLPLSDMISQLLTLLKLHEFSDGKPRRLSSSSGGGLLRTTSAYDKTLLISKSTID